MSHVNILTTPHCPNNCNFCFAKDWIADALKTKPDPLSIEQIGELISFFKKSKEKGYPVESVGIMGGEPFTYKHLRYLIDQLVSSGMSRDLVIFSGGVFNPDAIKQIDGFQDNLSVSINLKEKKGYHPQKNHKIVLDNIETLIYNGFSTGISYNIDSPEFNGNEIVDFALDQGINDLRIAIANPVYKSHSAQVISPALYDTLSQKVFDFLVESREKGVNVGIDCKLPLCFFTNEQIGELHKKQPLAVRALGSCACGKGPIDIDHKLEVSKCFPFRQVKQPLSKFNSLNEAREWLFQNVDSKFDTPSIKPECKNCEYKNRCSGGCLASNKHEFLSNETENEKLDKIYSTMNESVKKFKEDYNNRNGNEFENKILSITKQIRNHPIIPFWLYAYYSEIGEKEKSIKYYKQFTRINQGYIPHKGAEEFAE